MFEKAGKLTDLVGVLRNQHQAGRKVTEQIIALAKSTTSSSVKEKELARQPFTFNRMYRPHKAREDTILFPALRTVVSPKEFDVMGDEFEEHEHRMFGEKGYESIVEKIAGYEKKLGIHELAKFTPAI